MVVRGKSGVGKTTSVLRVLRSIIGTSGDEFNPNSWGYGGQDPTILPGGLIRNIRLSFADNLDEADSGVLALASKLGLGDVIERLHNNRGNIRPISLSGGELTRLEVLRAHFGTPQFVVLDEPTTGLDSAAVSQLAAWINENSASYIVITHDEDFASLLNSASHLEII